MSLAKVPLVPQWNLTSGCVCTPDGGFLYVGCRSINFISSADDQASGPLIRVFHTRQGIVSVDVDPAWGQKSKEGVDEQKLFVALGQDNSIQIWDFVKACAIQGHKAHFSVLRYMEGNGPSPQRGGDHVLVSYMRNRNVLSIDAQDVVVYCVASNTYCRRAMFVSTRNQQLTVLRCSPYNENSFAVGTSRGLVLVCDLQQMCIVYTLRGHDASITSLSWNCVDLNRDLVKPEAAPPKKAKTAKPETDIFGGDDIFDIYDYDYLDNEFGVPSGKGKELSPCDTAAIETSAGATADKFDFAEACESLKKEIEALQEEPQHIVPQNVVSLEECKEMEHHNDLSSSCPSGDDNGSTEGSLELIDRSSSDDSVGVDGTEHKPKQQILHQAEIHATQAPEQRDGVGDAHNEEEMETEVEQRMDEDVELVTRCPESGLKDILLASASVDGTFWIWNAETGAACDNLKARGGHGGKNTQIEVAWLSATSFVTSNRQGDLQQWSLQPVPTLSTNSPDRYMSPPYKFKETKWHGRQRSVVSFAVHQREQLVWCISSNREISLEDMKDSKLRAKFSCVSTNIAAMRECPDDMNKIALGFSDRRIGIIDISKMSATSIYIQNFTHRIESPVLSLAWSPDNKKLAYGTSEGRIGVLNVESSNKQQPFIFNPVCGKPIYSMCWQDGFIFVVCNDRVAVYEDDLTKKDAHIVPGIQGVSAISVRGRHLFVGTQRGHLQVYCRKPEPSTEFLYELQQELELAPRYITEIAWSPIATDRMAVVANANSVHVLQFQGEAGRLVHRRKIELKAPKAANASVKWSNRSEHELLTCGFDGAVRVWDLSNEQSDVERFLKHYHCPMTCGLFLPTDEQVIVCAGKSTSLEFIDMRVEQSEDCASKAKRSAVRALDSVQWATKVVTRSDGKAKPRSEKRRSHRTAAGADDGGRGGGGHEAVEAAEIDQSPEENVEKAEKAEKGDVSGEDDVEVATMLNNLKLEKLGKAAAAAAAAAAASGGGSMFMKNPSTLLYLTTRELNKEALDVMYVLLTASYNKQYKNKSLCAKLFGSKANAKELLDEELRNHQHSETKGISGVFMSQLGANLKDEILKCVQSKQLNEWHVSLAPSISYSFWQKCCRAFAEQLMEQGFTLQAATYLLAIHHHQEAINMLLEKNYFKESLLVGRLYLQPDDPLMDTITEQWISYLDSTGNLPGAALLCLLSQQMNRAYECLAKVRNTVPEIERVLKLLKTAVPQTP